MNLDYTAQNSLSRYPFKDSATLLWSSLVDAKVLPNDIFLDAKIVIKTQVNTTVALKSITYEAGTPSNVSITFDVNSVEKTVSFDTNSAGIVSFTDTSIVIVLELNILSLTNYFNALSGSPVVCNFIPTDNLLCNNVVIHAAPTVDQVTFENTTDLGLSETVVIKDDYIDLREGSNLQFSGSSSLNMSVIAGAGQGLYDSCDKLKDVIYNINDIAANAFHNYSITGDNCYKLPANLAEHGIEINNSCKASCTEEELQAFAFYLNRVKDGMLSLVEYIKSVKGGYDQLLSQYSKIVEGQKAIKAPYLLVENAVSSNRTKDFNTITCGIYSPSKVELPSKLDVVKDNMFSLVEGTSYVTQDGNKKLQAGLGYNNRVMKCNDVIFHGFVLSDDKLNGISPNNDGDQKFDVKFYLTSSKSRAFFSIPLLAKTPNYSVAYTVLEEGSTNRIRLNIQLQNPKNTSLLTSLILNIPPQFTFVKGVLIENRSIVTPITSAFGFRDVQVGYNGNCLVSMEYTYEVTPASPNVEITMSTADGIARKFIPFVF